MGGGRKLKFYVYILASNRNGTLYVGMTNDLRSRIAQHKSAAIPGFTQKYDVKMLVYFEEFNDSRDAIAREKQLKWWRRKWKLQLIESVNPEWKDIAFEL
jgi:putative endonuclease